MTEPANLPESQSTEADDDEIRLLDLLIVLVKHKKLVLGLPFVVAVLAAGVSFLLPNVYTASTKLLPPQQSQSAGSAMLAQIPGVAGLLGGVVRNPNNDVYIAMLRSRTIADELIQKFDLIKRYDAAYPSQARNRLAELSGITAGKDGVITIEVDDENPKRAADLANAYVDELLKLTQVLAVTETSQRRLFFERQFALAKDNLANAEIAARQALERGGLVKVDDQGRAIVEVTARLRAQITVKEVQIGAMRTFAADRNPDLQLAQKELESLKQELAKIEGVGGSRVAGIETDGKGMESLRLLRNVKYHEVIFELLARQYEAAKIDEAKDSAVIQVMDKAIEPDSRSRPKRRQIVILAALVALFVAILIAFICESIDRAGRDPEHVKRLKSFKRYLTWR